MHAIATRADFNRLSVEQQDKFSSVLRECHALGLPCRCEMIEGKDFSIVIAPGLPLARHWLDRLDLDET